MTALIYIVNLQTLELVAYEEDDWVDILEFMWTDGNYACDCNRHLYFVRAGGEEIGFDESGPCGDTRYRVLGALLHDGTWVKLDEPKR